MPGLGNETGKLRRRERETMRAYKCREGMHKKRRWIGTGMERLGVEEQENKTTVR